jgi:hypothetical protein
MKNKIQQKMELAYVNICWLFCILALETCLIMRTAATDELTGVRLQYAGICPFVGF